MLEDKEGKNVKARILIKQKCLLDWIKIIDKFQKRYTIREVQPKGDFIKGERKK